MYQALYRKWRPRTFDEVVGQPHITETLKRQVATGHLSHAYLFTGTRGTGKTTCAKILARAVNCEHPVDGNPCNCCPSCLGIENGSILDVLELDAASNNGVDQIRALRDEATYTPAAVQKRVYIVDEVHMLSMAAFNALLKILEEPPAHLMFILATTELHKVPATIKSRCQQFAFKRISPKALTGRLEYVAQQEHIPLTSEAAELLARLADGGLRDGLSLLDQCSGSEGELSEAVVLDVLGLAGNRKTASLLDCVAREDTSAALTVLDELYRDGKDMGALLSEIAALVRDLLVRKTAPEGGKNLLTGGYEERVIRPLTEAFTAAELVQMMMILQNAQADLYRSASRRTDAELCLIRLCDRRLSDTAQGLSARLSRLEAQLAHGVVPKAVPAPGAEAPAAPQPKIEPEKPAQPEGKVSPLPQSAAPPIQQQVLAPASAVKAGDWNGFLKTLRGLPPMVHSFLHKPESAQGVFDEHTLTIWTDSELTMSFLNRGDTPAMLERAAEAYTGQKRRVKFQVGKPPAQPPAQPAAQQEVPKEDKFNDLLAFGEQFGNFKVT